MFCEPDFQDFSAKYERGESQLLWSQFLTDLETPVSAILKLRKLSKYHLLYESVEGGKTRARYSIIALDPDVIWRCQNGVAQLNHTPEDDSAFADDVISGVSGVDPFTSLRNFLKISEIAIPDQLPPMSCGVFGYMSYDMVRFMENLPCDNPDIIGIADSIYMRPKIVVIFDSVKDVATIVTPVRVDEGLSGEAAYSEAQSRINNIIDTLNSSLKRTLFSQYYAGEITDNAQEVKSHISRAEYDKIVKKAKDYIVAGDVFQVVPSRRFSLEFNDDPIALYRSLRHLNPSPYLFYLNMNDFSIIGSSPEVLVSVKDKNIVTIRPIAGTRPRGKNNAEDIALEEDLLHDGKELSEHLMLLDLGRNDVGRVAKTGSVTVTEKMIIELYSHVMHIVSNVEGVLRDDKDGLDALIAGFPAGTVSGAPKIRAMEIIDELESEKRSFYGGTVGYFSSNGGVDSCIALRTGLIKDGVLYAQAGGGIVADSDPEAEFLETEAKAGAIIKAAENAKKFA